MTELEKGLIILDGLFDIDYKFKRELVDQLSSVNSLTEFADLSLKFLKTKIQNFDEKLYISRFTEKEYNNLISEYSNKGVKVITELSSIYPSELKDLPFRPICLYLLGNEKLLAKKDKFSIVGSRKTTPSILKITEEYAKKLSKSGVVIVTGVAGGGDLSAIKGAVQSGNLICVSASGFDYLDKEYTRDYTSKIIKNALIISEYPPCVQAMPYFYPIRNRIIAGLSKGTLVISGSYKSGTRYTYNYALEYGKEVFAFPYGLGVSSGEICNEIIKQGGYMVTELEDITSSLGFTVAEKEEIPLSDNEYIVLSSIKNGNYSVDDVLNDTSLKIFELMPTLTSLEIKNLIVKSGSDYMPVKN